MGGCYYGDEIKRKKGNRPYRRKSAQRITHQPIICVEWNTKLLKGLPAKKIVKKREKVKVKENQRLNPVRFVYSRKLLHTFKM